MGATGPDSTSPVDNRILDATQLKETYSLALNQDARVADVLRVLDAIIARDAEEDISTEEILSAISSLRELTIANTKEIQYLHTLIGKLVFQILKQGMDIDDKELLNEVKRIYK